MCGELSEGGLEEIVGGIAAVTGLVIGDAMVTLWGNRDYEKPQVKQSQ